MKALLFNRDSFKKKITFAVEFMSAEAFLNKTCFKKQESLINKLLTEFDAINTKISQACEKADIDLEKSSMFEAKFVYNIFKRLTGLEENISSSNTEAIPMQNPQVPLAASCVSAPRLQWNTSR